MIKVNVNHQKQKEKTWKDEGGFQVQVSRLSKVEKLKESSSSKLLKNALILNDKLAKYKTEIRIMCQDVYEEYMAEHNKDVDDYKGNFTWYNFDRSIKIEVSINDRIEFDDLGIIACKEKLDSFLNQTVTTENDIIKQLVLDAFHSSRGKLDHKKVMSLLKYRSKIKNPLFLEALDLIEQSIRTPDSKTYFRISAKNLEGKYENIDLNFSSIQ